MTQSRIVNALTALVTLLVLAIGAGAFILSYDALLAVARQNGQPIDKAWIWPLLIDAPLVVFTLGLLVYQLMRERVRFWWLLVAGYTLATIAFNLAHAPETVLGRVVAVVAPLGLFLTTEALRHLARTIIERGAAIQGLAELVTRQQQARAEFERQQAEQQAELARLAERINADLARIEAARLELQAIRAQKKAEQYTDVAEDTRSKALAILRERSDISGAELGRLLDRSDTLARRLKRELMPLVLNGTGHKEMEG
jgi:hypothetical protein